MACGTGEHPCTQLALEALERCVRSDTRVADVGTGSGILAIAALRLGAAHAVAIDNDEAALHAARENFALNEIPTLLVAGSADAVTDGWADITVANISANALAAMLGELRRITGANGRLILSGFTEGELPAFEHVLRNLKTNGIEEWRCLSGELSPDLLR